MNEEEPHITPGVPVRKGVGQCPNPRAVFPGAEAAAGLWPSGPPHSSPSHKMLQTAPGHHRLCDPALGQEGREGAWSIHYIPGVELTLHMGPHLSSLSQQPAQPNGHMQPVRCAW